MVNAQQDVQPTGGQPTGAPDFPDQPPSLVPTQRYVVVVPGGTFDGSHDVPPVAPSQVQVVACDFGLFLPPGTTLTGTPVVTIVGDINGVDPDPSDVLDGVPALGSVPGPYGTGVAAAAVLQRLNEFVAGARYLVQVTCARSDGDAVEWYFRVPCVAPD